MRGGQISLRDFCGNDRISNLLLRARICLEPALILRIGVSIVQHRQLVPGPQWWWFRAKTPKTLWHHGGQVDAAIGKNILIFAFGLLSQPVKTALPDNEF